MSFRFRRSVRIMPGVRLNFSRKGTSVSFGGRGFHYTVGKTGTRTTIGVPGTGMSWTKFERRPRPAPDHAVYAPPPIPDASSVRKLRRGMIVAFFLFLAFGVLMAAFALQPSRRAEAGITSAALAGTAPLPHPRPRVQMNRAPLDIRPAAAR